jgi:hypothetical protein
MAEKADWSLWSMSGPANVVVFQCEVLQRVALIAAA